MPECGAGCGVAGSTGRLFCQENSAERYPSLYWVSPAIVPCVFGIFVLATGPCKLATCCRDAHATSLLHQQEFHTSLKISSIFDRFKGGVYADFRN